MPTEKQKEENHSSNSELESQWIQWMRKAQGGDSEAYEMLLSSISPFLEQFIARRIFDKSYVEDILQESLLGIHKARATFDSDKSFGAWMYAIARYKMTDFIRKKSRRERREVEGLPIESLGAENKGGAPEPQLSEKLQEALERLPQKQMLVVKKLKLEGRTIKQISNELKMSESAVKVTAHRAYKKLFKIIEEGVEK